MLFTIGENLFIDRSALILLKEGKPVEGQAIYNTKTTDLKVATEGDLDLDEPDNQFYRPVFALTNNLTSAKRATMTNYVIDLLEIYKHIPQDLIDERNAKTFTYQELVENVQSVGALLAEAYMSLAFDTELVVRVKMSGMEKEVVADSVSKALDIHSNTKFFTRLQSIEIKTVPIEQSSYEEQEDQLTYRRVKSMGTEPVYTTIKGEKFIEISKLEFNS